MKNILDFVHENQHEFEPILEAFASSKLTEFSNSMPGNFSIAQRYLKTAKIDIQLSKLQDDDIETYSKKTGSSGQPISDGKTLRKMAKKDGYIRIFFQNGQNCSAITVGEFTVAGDTKYNRNNFSRQLLYKTVHGAFDDCAYMLTIKNKENASGLSELVANRGFNKKDALALKNLDDLVRNNRARFRKAAEELRKEKMLKDNSATTWLEKDINDVIDKFGKLIKDSFAEQDFSTAERIASDLNQIISYTEDISDKFKYIDRTKASISKIEDNDEYSKKYYTSIVDDYHIDIAELLRRINEKLERLEYFNNLEK